MFALADMGRKRILPMFSLYVKGFFILAAVSLTRVAKALEWLTPVLLGPLR